MLDDGQLPRFAEIVDELAEEKNTTPLAIASALCLLAQREQPFFLDEAKPLEEVRAERGRRFKPPRKARLPRGQNLNKSSDKRGRRQFRSE
jgi:hypothetical protein